ncbi:MAG: NAD-dependent epimerase/dehydratase family protein [Candidatus Uhrbacteria bacterium]|nr:NAD-dependent epimerase/dehydratase family protein [Candidatus Uhrbacteria bacterium]
MKQKILLLGAGGFLGRHLCDYLLSKEGEYTVVEIGSQSELFSPERMIHIDAAERDIPRMIERFSPTVIINAIGSFSRSPQECFNVNAFFPRALMHAIKDTGIQLILIGSAAEYGMASSDAMPLSESYPLKPVSDYGASKAVQSFYKDSFFSSNGSDIRLARVFNLIGQGLSVKLAPGGFAERIAKLQKEGGTSMHVGNLKPKRDYLGVSSACCMLEAIMNKGKAGETYHVCSGYSVSMESLVLDMLEQAGMKDVTLEVDPTLLKGFDIPDIYGSTQKIGALLSISREELEDSYKKDLHALLVGAGIAMETA